jgi:hypothetical protein
VLVLVLVLVLALALTSMRILFTSSLGTPQTYSQSASWALLPQIGSL